jgi:eukaryotic-like serine/threonine-protein kinase
MIAGGDDLEGWGMKLDSGSLGKAIQAFETLTELEDGSAEALDVLATLDPEARRFVQRMLESARGREASWLDTPIWSHLDALGLAPVNDTELEDDWHGRTFGNWRALEVAGRGGMAVVLKGERADGYFEKQVAIKLLRVRPDQPLEPERLLQEVRILARLQHPNIAGLLDGGIDNGLPWLVMEYIEGEPITHYCHRNRLGLQDSVALFEQVVDAVSHAHSRLVVHCDIKPSNVLVTPTGQVKLVDFGVSNLLSVAGAPQGHNQGIYCTPGYAAPEQLAGAAVATTHDVFGLGALLHELLTGRRFRAIGDATALLGGLRNLPPTSLPSECLASSPDEQVVPWGATDLRGDLDAICLRAVVQDPALRYANAELLAEELRRWRCHLPVAAVNGGRSYRVGKWLRRHRLPAAAAAMVAIALIAGSGVALWQAGNARAEAALALSVKEFMLEMFDEVDPWRSGQEEVTVNEVMDTALANLPKRLDRHPRQRADVQDHLGRILRRLGRHDEAVALHLQAADTWQRSAQQDRFLDSRVSAAQAAINGYDLERAIALLDEVIEQSAWPPRHQAVARARVHRAELMTRSGELERQRLMIEEVLNEQARIVQFQDGQALLAEALLIAAEAAENRADYEQAVDYALQGAAVFESLHGADHPTVGKAHSYVATSRYAQTRYAEALEAIDRVLDIDRRYLGDDHPQTLWSRYTRSRILVDIGQLDEASSELEAIVEQLIEQYGADDPRLGVSYANLAKVRRGMGDLDGAIDWFARGLPIMTAHEAEHPKFGVYQGAYAMVLTEAGRLEQARLLFDESLALLHDKLGPDHPETAMALLGWSGYLVASGQAGEAQVVAREALAVIESLESGHDQRLGLAHLALGDALAAGGDTPQAMEHWQAALTILDRHEYRGSSQFELQRLMARMTR